MTSVLIVDDDAQVRRALTRLLAINGFEPATATTIDEAMQAIRDAQPEIVLLDISLGRESGLELQRTLRAAHTRVPPVIFVTGQRDMFGEICAHLGPADDWVIKPWDPAELTARIRLALRRAA